jgi:hypothetical protein
MGGWGTDGWLEPMGGFGEEWVVLGDHPESFHDFDPESYTFGVKGIEPLPNLADLSHPNRYDFPGFFII